MTKVLARATSIHGNKGWHYSALLELGTYSPSPEQKKRKKPKTKGSRAELEVPQEVRIEPQGEGKARTKTRLLNLPREKRVITDPLKCSIF